MEKCKTCIHAKFDELWGEWKCMAYLHKIYEWFDCKQYQKKKEEK